MKKYINIRNITNFSLALLICISRGANAMEDTTEVPNMTRNNYATILQEIEELTKRIHAEVDKVLSDYRRDTEEYHRRLGIANRVMPQLNTTAIVEDVEKNLTGKQETKDVEENPENEKEVIQEKIEKARSLGFKITDYKYFKELSNDKDKNKLLDNAIHILKKNKHSNENRSKLGILRFTPSYLHFNDEIWRENIEKKLDQDISTQKILLSEDELEKAIKMDVDFKPLFTLGTPVTSGAPDEKYIKNWLHEKITIKETTDKITQKTMNIAELKQLKLKEQTSNPESKELIQWLNTQIDILEKVEKLMGFGVNPNLLEEFYNPLTNIKKIKWLDAQINIFNKIKEAKTENVVKKVVLDNLQEQSSKEIDIAALNRIIETLETKTAVAVKSKKYKDLTSSANLPKEFNALQTDIDKINWLDTNISAYSNKLASIQQKEQQARDLGVDLSKLQDLKKRSQPDVIIKWLDEQIDIEEKVQKLKGFGVDPNLQKGFNAQTYTKKINWLDEQINIEEKVQKLKGFGVDPNLQKGFNAQTYTKKINWLDEQIAIEQNLARADKEKVKKARELNVDFSVLKRKDILGKEYINKWLDNKIAIEEKKKEALSLSKPLNGNISFMLTTWQDNPKDDEYIIQWLDARIDIFNKIKEAKTENVMKDTLEDFIKQSNNEENIEELQNIRKNLELKIDVAVKSKEYKGLIGNPNLPEEFSALPTDEDKIRWLEGKIQEKK
jgi:hypothetical protein